MKRVLKIKQGLNCKHVKGWRFGSWLFYRWTSGECLWIWGGK